MNFNFLNESELTFDIFYLFSFHFVPRIHEMSFNLYEIWKRYVKWNSRKLFCDYIPATNHGWFC